MFLAVAALGSCSYDSSEIEGSITELEQQIAALEQRTRELKALSIEILNLAKQAKEWLRI